MYSSENLHKELERHYESLTVGEVYIASQDKDSNKAAESDNHKSHTCKTVPQFGRHFVLPSHVKLEDCVIFYIGKEDMALTNWMLHLKDCVFYSYDPATQDCKQQGLNVNKFLMKRYYLIEKAKDAQIVGLLVGTLGVADYMDSFDRMKKLCALAGKKTYTFVMGKLNVAKLANFMEVDVYVLVACPQNSLLDSSEFYRPVITPYELEMACNQKRDWTGQLITDFRSLLPGI